jgi:hypothetical protein
VLALVCPVELWKRRYMQTPESQQELALKNLDRLETREARMVWAGSVANAALLLAIIGLSSSRTREPHIASQQIQDHDPR